jgi:hypothetical protein
MVALMMIMRHKLSHRISQHILTKEDHLIQTAFFDRPDKGDLSPMSTKK